MAYLVEPSAGKEDVFGAQCPLCGHVSYFKKGDVCPVGGEVQRELIHRGGLELDGLYLTCRSCGTKMVVPVDCRGYK